MYIVSYSGGKDSTATLLWTLAKYGKKNVVTVFNDTGAEFPETYEYLEYIEKKLNIKIHRVKSDKWDWFSLVRYLGKFFDAKYRTCTSRLKTEPTAKWITANCNRKKDIFITGERRQESNRRTNYQANYYNKNLRIQGFRPILNWTTREVWEAIKQAGLSPHPVYKHFTRLGCYCCVFNTIDEWVQLYKHYRNLFEKVAKLEEEIGYTLKRDTTLRELIKRNYNPYQLELQVWQKVGGGENL